MQVSLIFPQIGDQYCIYKPLSFTGQVHQSAIRYPTSVRHIPAHQLLAHINSPSHVQSRHYRIDNGQAVDPRRTFRLMQPRARRRIHSVRCEDTTQKFPRPDLPTSTTPLKTSQKEIACQCLPDLAGAVVSPSHAQTEKSLKNGRCGSKDYQTHLQPTVVDQGPRSELETRKTRSNKEISNNTQKVRAYSQEAAIEDPSQSSSAAAVNGRDVAELSQEVSLPSSPVRLSLPTNGVVPEDLTDASQRQREALQAGRSAFLTQTQQMDQQHEANQSSSSQSSTRTKLSNSNSHAHQRLSHLTSSGDVHMVDISPKISTGRCAVATAFVQFSNRYIYASLTDKILPKGDAIAVARIAGIQAAKKTADLIPLAHPGLVLTAVRVDIELLVPATTKEGLKQDRDPDSIAREAGYEFGGVKITAHVSCDGKTGVEMEALSAATVAALTIYDMCKAIDKHMLITGVRVIEKTGGKSGGWKLGPDASSLSLLQKSETAPPREMAGSHRSAKKLPLEDVVDVAAESEPHGTQTESEAADNIVETYSPGSTSATPTPPPLPRQQG